MQAVHLREYGVQATINFDLFEVDGVDFRIDAAHAAGDSKIMKDEAAEGNTANAFTDEGQGYSIVLSATELQAKRIVIYLVDLTATKVWLDKSIVIETYGHASAQHAFNLNTATQDVNVASQDNIDFGATQKASITAAVPTVVQNRQEMDSNSVELGKVAELTTQGDTNETHLNTLLTRIAQTLNLTASGNIGIDWANVENPTTVLDLAGTVIDLCDTVTTLTGHTPQTSDHTAILTAIAGYIDTEIAAIKAKTDTLPADPASETNVNANETKIDALKVVADAIKVITDALPESGAFTTIGADTARLTAARAQVLTDWIDAGRLDLLLDAIPTTAMRGTDGANTTVPDAAGIAATLIGALNDLSSAEILTTALTESYAADGATATLSQLLYMVWSVMNSLGFVSTTGTARGLDGTTPKMTFTIDDANSPTDINRTT